MACCKLCSPLGSHSIIITIITEICKRPTYQNILTAQWEPSGEQLATDCNDAWHAVRTKWRTACNRLQWRVACSENQVENSLQQTAMTRGHAVRTKWRTACNRLQWRVDMQWEPSGEQLATDLLLCMWLWWSPTVFCKLTLLTHLQRIERQVK